MWDRTQYWLVYLCSEWVTFWLLYPLPGSMIMKSLFISESGWTRVGWENENYSLLSTQRRSLLFSALSIFHLFSYKSSQGENINYFLPVLNIFIQEESLNSYKFQLTLTIKSLQPEDFGTYRCISKNSIGQAEEVVELYGEILNINMVLSGENRVNK